MDTPDTSIVIFVGLCNLLFYAINTNIVSLFANLSFLFLAIFNLNCINLLRQFELMNTFVLSQKLKIRGQQCLENQIKITVKILFISI
jgi:hypothetical protein